MRRLLWVVAAAVVFPAEAVLAQGAAPAAPESPIPKLEVLAHWEGPSPREMPLLLDLNGDGAQDYLLASAQVGPFKEYMPPEVGAQFGLIGLLVSEKAATGNKNFCLAAAVDGATGKVLWKFTAGGYIQAYRLSADGKRLYLASHDDSLYALDAATGQKVWSYNLGGGIVGLSLSDAGLVGVTTANRVVGLDPLAGTPRWEKSIPIPLMSEGWGYCLEGAGYVYVVSMDDKVHAYAVATGQERWTHPTKGNPSLKAIAAGVLMVADGRGLAGVDLETGREAWVCDLGGRPYLEPARMVGETLITFNGKAGSGAQVVAVQAGTGKKLWSVAVQKLARSRDRTIIMPEDMNYFRSALAMGPLEGGVPQTLFLADRKRVIGVEFSTGRTLWETPVKDVQAVCSAGGRVVAQDKEAVLHGLDAKTGKVLWTCPAGSYLRRADTFAGLMVGVFSGHGGLVVDLGTGAIVKRLTLGAPAVGFPWGPEAYFVSSAGHNFALKPLPDVPPPAETPSAAPAADPPGAPGAAPGP